MKSRFTLVLTLTLLIVFCAPGLRGEVNPYYKPQLSLPSLASPQAPVVYTTGVGYSTFGIKLFGGLSLGTIRHDLEGIEDVDDYIKYLLGLVGGIGFEAGGRFGVEVDIMYVQKGVKLDVPDQDVGGGELISFRADVVFNQISMPVLFRIKFLPGTSPYILFGGTVSYILSSEAEYTMSSNLGGTETGSEDLYADDAENFGRLDYGVVGGVGLEVAFGSTMHVFFEGRYIYGLANILHENARGDGDSLKLTTILLVGGFGF